MGKPWYLSENKLFSQRSERWTIQPFDTIEVAEQTFMLNNSGWGGLTSTRFHEVMYGGWRKEEEKGSADAVGKIYIRPGMPISQVLVLAR